MVLKGRQLHDHAFIYAYQLDPPQPEPRFTKIKALLRRAKLAAGRNGELWTGRIVVETNITHILVVTDDPHQVHEVDRAIQAELKRLNMKFALTGPARFAFPKRKKPAPRKSARLTRLTLARTT